MIDYEKLKNRIEFLETKLNDLQWRMNAVCNELSLREEVARPEPNPKYEYGSIVFHSISRNTVIKSKVEHIESYGSGFVYTLDNAPSLNEDYLFPTRQALIEHQIEYWIDELKMLPEFSQLTGKCSDKCDKNCDKPVTEKPCDNMVTCKHQSDPDYIDPGAPGIPKGVLQKCIKCHGTYFPAKCQHESDGDGYPVNGFSPRCIKCGEFYR